LIADDNAIEDTIYHLHRALNAGRIDLERFLRVSMAKKKKKKRLPHHDPFLSDPVNPCIGRRAIHETRPDREDPDRRVYNVVIIYCT
jgi:hypothetical protein